MEKPIGIILAAGRGTRMRHLTEALPKPLIEVRGKPLIVHLLEELTPHVSKIVIVDGYLGSLIREKIGSTYNGVTIVYTTQENYTGGTLDAVRVGIGGLQESDLKEVPGFIVAYSDDIHGKDSFAALAKSAETHPERVALVGMRVTDPVKRRAFGVFVFDGEGRVMGIEEKPQSPPSEFINCALQYFPKRMQPQLLSTVEKSSSGEEYLTDVIDAWIRQEGAEFIEATYWEPIGTPEDVAKAEVQGVGV